MGTLNKQERGNQRHPFVWGKLNGVTACENSVKS